ncbi:rab-GTPase-TBC domain-containing protein [Hirsutella rhossiliensis]|uniref:Rab-GTPase-TBC domain-containing protein n=1 Tax=Hirsutella rhossiliensis TaxID=111463 RepID=A0A9P8N4T9_9HYPO|nr:rab-GTPase-TBC domain-containing protein [Hirsutella rhossiliensis]KAH0968453.1 rab-GTPase-TBC domain-containing protein [Hirsutella rhossiliensis]
MYTMALSPLDDDGPVQRHRSVRNRQCSVYASRIRPVLAPLALDGGPPPAHMPQVPQLPPLPVSPRWDSLSNGSHVIHHSPESPTNPLDRSWPEPPSHQFVASPMRPLFSPVPSDTQSASADSRSSSPFRIKGLRPEVRSPDCVMVENFSRPRKQSIRQQPAVPEQCAPEAAVPCLAHLAPTDLLGDMGPSAPQTPPWQRPRRPSASSCQSASTYSSPLGPPPTVDLPDPRCARARNATGPPLTAARPPFAVSSRTPDSAASSPMMGGGAPPPWLAGDELRSSFRSQLSASTAFGTAVTERSSVLTKDSSITSLYANTDEPSLEDVMCMYEKGFADDEEDDNPVDNLDDGQDDANRGDSPPNSRGGSRVDNRDNQDTAFGPDDANDAPPREIVTVTPPEAQSDAAPDTRPVPVMSASDGQLADAPPPIPTSRSMLDAEIRQSKMIFSSPAFTSSVPALSSKAEVDEPEKRDSGKSLDSEPSFSDPALAADSFKKSVAVPPSLPPSASATFRAAMEPEDPGSRDRYGFKKQNQSISREQYDTWNKGYTQYLARRHKKWVAYLKECALMTDRPNRFPPPNAKTKRFVRKGIPPDWRGAAWFYYAGGPAILAKHSGLYEKLLDREVKQVDVEAIERDLHRTFPDNIQFQPFSAAEDRSPGSPPPADEPPIVSSLRRVLHAFAVYNPRIGYCQSLNFLAGLLLLFVETEEQCFWLLNVITIIYLPGTHEMSLEGSKVDLGVLMTELRDTMPAVWDMIGGELEGAPAGARPGTGKSARKPLPMLRRRDQPSLSTDRLPPITLCMTAWFMSCYIGTLPIETTLRVWDVFFYEGSKTLFRIALAIFKSGEAEIKAVSDPMEMFGVVQSLPRRMLDANALMEACFKRRNGFGHISQDAIDERRQERREQAQLDRAHQLKLSGKPGTGGNLTEVDTDSFRRKGTLFGRKRRDVSRPRAAEV